MTSGKRYQMKRKIWSVAYFRRTLIIELVYKRPKITYGLIACLGTSIKNIRSVNRISSYATPLQLKMMTKKEDPKLRQIPKAKEYKFN